MTGATIYGKAKGSPAHSSTDDLQLSVFPFSTWEMVGEWSTFKIMLHTAVPLSSIIRDKKKKVGQMTDPRM